MVGNNIMNTVNILYMLYLKYILTDLQETVADRRTTERTKCEIGQTDRENDEVLEIFWNISTDRFLFIPVALTLV